MRLFRLFQLMDQFRTCKAPVTARELAELTGVSVRSVYRDIADLQGMGAPIRGEGGIGYVLERGYFMPSLSFDPEELEVVALGMKLAAEHSGGRLAEAAGRAVAKISSALGDASREEFLTVPMEAGRSAPGTAMKASSMHDDLRDLIRRRRLVELTYCSLDGVHSTRRARPLGLTVFDDSWLLTIWCEKSGDFRNMRVDRIIAAEDSGLTFRHQPGMRFSDAVALERKKLLTVGPRMSSPAETRVPGCCVAILQA
jgi:predicted DNA-binding transcriptional regulator YafY